MRKYIILRVNCETVGWVSHVECGRNLGRAQFFTYRLAALRLPSGDLSVKQQVELGGVLAMGRIELGFFIGSILRWDRLGFYYL